MPSVYGLSGSGVREKERERAIVRECSARAMSSRGDDDDDDDDGMASELLSDKRKLHKPGNITYLSYMSVFFLGNGLGSGLKSHTKTESTDRALSLCHM